MMLQALLRVAPTANDMDRAALATHATMLEHGFICVGTTEPASSEGAVPVVSTDASGGVTLQLLPAGWNATPESYGFCYAHPLRGASETFSVKALAISGSLAVHAASSSQGGDLLTVTLKVGEADLDLQEKVAAGIAIRLLGRHNSTARFGKAVDPAEPPAPQSDRTAPGQKRPAPEGPDRQPVPTPTPAPERPGLDPFFFPERGPAPPLWIPDGGLLGPRHPAWGQPIPVGGRRPGGGFLPRFDPIGPGVGPGIGEPDPDHLRVPFHPDFPGIPGPGQPRRGLDPFNGPFM